MSKSLKNELDEKELSSVTGGTVTTKNGHTIYTFAEAKQHIGETCTIYDFDVFMCLGTISRCVANTVIVLNGNGIDYEFKSSGTNQYTCGPFGSAGTNGLVK